MDIMSLKKYTHNKNSNVFIDFNNEFASDSCIESFSEMFSNSQIGNMEIPGFAKVIFCNPYIIFEVASATPQLLYCIDVCKNVYMSMLYDM